MSPSASTEQPSPGRLVVVSNRLPVTLSQTNGEWEARASSGGLASAMEPILRQTGGLWIGWAGDDGELAPEQRASLLSSTAQDFAYIPVEFPPGAGEAFYKGYPNQTVWPLFHLFPARMNFDPPSWHDYVAGNEHFAATVAANLREGDLIWIHDYHLMLLPRMLREQDPAIKLGFFLHIPFPSSEAFAFLPRGDEVLLGLLGADLLAFHTHQHLQHFRSCLLRILAIESSMDSVEYQGRTIKLEALPIGIDPTGLASLIEHDPRTKERIEELRSQYADKHVIVAVDRLDYTKGIPERLHAFRTLMRQRPDLKEKVVMLQVAVPSREGIGEYQSLSSEINELVGEINGEFGTPQWTPVMYLRQSIERSSLAALYAVADVAWVTPLRDGMNLVAKEYCACKLNDDGVLVLSQFAGAAVEMGEALLVNPYDEEQVATAVERALSMRPGEKKRRMRHLRERVSRNDVFDWARRFLKSLAAVGLEQTPSAQALNVRSVEDAYKKASRRLLILDYDGTLVPIQDNPGNAVPPDALIRTLTRLAADPRNVVAVLSGRGADEIEDWLGAIPGLHLGAEHGALSRKAGTETWEHLVPTPGAMEWKAKMRSVFEHFVQRAPGSFVEEKEYSIVWHYRRVEPQFGHWLAAELAGLMEGLLAETDARPVLGRGIVEVRPVWVNKGLFASHLLAEEEPSFQLGAGDDSTDEDVFDRLGEHAWTIHVGTGRSRAKYWLKDTGAMLRLLDTLAATAEARAA